MTDSDDLHKSDSGVNKSISRNAPTDDREQQRRNILTKEVHPAWYRRYAKILEYDERIYIQPLRELQKEKALLKALGTPPEPIDQIAMHRSQQLAEARGKKVQMVLQILEGNLQVDVKSLDLKSEQPLHITKPPEEKRQTLFWRQRAVRPPGYVLSEKSKWRFFWESPSFMRSLRELIQAEKSAKIKAKWIKGFRTLQGVNNFTAVLADIAGSTDETFKRFAAMNLSGNVLFDKRYFRATAVGQKMNQDVLFTLSKDNKIRTKEEAKKASMALRIINTFAEFPAFLQEKICEVAWYLEVDEDKFIIREGHVAESFYFLLSGKLIAFKSSSNDDEDFIHIRTCTTGSLIGEEVMTHPGYREYSVRATEKSKVIMVYADEYHQACLTADTEGIPPDHIIFLSQLTFMKFFPIHQLVSNSEGNIGLFYFRNGAVISNNIFQSKFIYVVFQLPGDRTGRQDSSRLSS